jgi:NAD(P)-dependent dehydrogenase (short-subunit alcohol dehydrogenase family)
LGGAWSRESRVRERHELRDTVEAALADLGRIDVVVANAGILPMAMGNPDPMHFVDASDVDLVGAMSTVAVTMPAPVGSGSV